MEDNSLLRTDKELAELYQRNVDMVYRLCYTYLKMPLMQRMPFSLCF